MGCLLDLAQCTMMVTLNGELQFSSKGSEVAAKNFDVMDGNIFNLSPFTGHYQNAVAPLNSLVFSVFAPTRFFACCERRVQPAGPIKPGPSSELFAVLQCLWPAGGVSTICCQHVKRSATVDELETATVHLNHVRLPQFTG